MIQILVDIVLVIVFLGGVIVGYNKGFLGIVERPAKIVVTVMLALALAPSVSDMIVAPYIEEPIVDFVDGCLDKNADDITEDNATEELPGILKFVAKVFKVDVNEVVENATGSIAEAITEKLAKPIINAISFAISFAVLLVISHIILTALLALINLIFKAKILGMVNKILGTVFGVVFSFVLAWGLAIILEFALSSSALSTLDWVIKFGDGGFVYEFLNKCDPIQWIFGI